MLPAFPFDSDRFEMTMNARPGVESLIEVEPELYAGQIALKAEILASDLPYYFRCPPDAESLAWEALETVLPDMARALPQFFTLARDGQIWTWTNRLLEREMTFAIGDASTLPQRPLEWLGRQVQEDLILMSANPDGETVCAAGLLCFGSGWALGDKMGKTFGAIHEEVPGFAERIGLPSDLLMRRLKPNRPVARVNWTIHATDEFNLAPALAPAWQRSRSEITPENAGTRCFLRVEYQTLTRLPRTGGVLFTIHTSLQSMAKVSGVPTQARRLARVLRDMPPATRRYKGMACYFDALLAYLDRRAE